MIPAGNFTTRIHLGLTTTFLVIVLITTSLHAAEDEISFNRDIRPILSEHCLQCHGFDENHREAGLRLDLYGTATRELDSGEMAIVPGQPELSELIVRITSDDESIQMPPPEMKKPLSAVQKALLSQWIKQGAPFQRHWSFLPIEKPNLPAASNRSSDHNPIDRFIDRTLNQSGLSASPLAEKATLLRRLSLDLIGLPPTLQDVKSFERDDDPQSYERMVDRLLDSPRYGEHRARYWLDAVRYGDTHGMARDDERSIWPYRDWVINAFNSNMPFDQFTIDQLAGDQLPSSTTYAAATTNSLVATGFLRCNVSTAEGGSIEEELISNYARDRVDTLSTVWMGMTMACAACHDHKYDPLSQKEYYQLVAFFNNLDEEPMNGNALAPDPVVQVPSDDQRHRLRQLAARQRKLKKQLSKARIETLTREFNHWTTSSAVSIQKQLQSDQTDNYLFKVGLLPETSSPTTRSVSEGSSQSQKSLADASGFGKNVTTKCSPWLASPAFHRKDNTAIYYDLDFGPENSDSLQTVTQDWKSIPDQDQPIRISDDNCAKFYCRQITTSVPETIRLRLSSNESTWKPIRWKVWLNGELIYFHQFQQADVPFAIEVPLNLGAGKNELLIRASHFGGPLRGNISIDNAGWKSQRAQLCSSLESLISGDATPFQENQCKEYFACHHWKTGLSFARQQLEIDQARFALEAEIPVSMVATERSKKRPTFVLNRGQYDQTREQVASDVPAVLPSISKNPSRLDLARWLVDDRHPLTARVAVNRIWEQFFGIGLVKTTEDFGSQGEWPSHPELLDYLASDFREHGWDVKRLIKIIVTSNAYRRSSLVASQKHLRLDPENRLLSRGPRYRLDAEVIRDQALFVSRRLVPEIGGRGVKPPQPSGLWRAVSQPNSSTANFVSDHGSDQHRRSVYTFWKRTAPPPTLQTFDAPTRESCVIRRARTNTPLQALLMMNERQSFEAAHGFANRIQGIQGTLQQKQTVAFRMLLSRKPTSKESSAMAQVFNRLLEHFQSHPDEVAQISNQFSDEVGAKFSDQTSSPDASRAAWVMFAGTLLNLSEAITKE